MSQDQQSAEEPAEDRTAVVRPWWGRFSPHGELPWSSAMSLIFHVFIILLVIILIAPFVKQDSTPPAVDVIYVSDEDNAAEGDDPLLPEGGVLTATDNQPLPPVPADRADVPVDEIMPPQPLQPELAPATLSKDAAAAAEAAQTALDRIKSSFRGQMAENLGGRGQQPGAGGGAQGTGRTGRAARQARWVLHFNTSSPKDYLAQLDGLGAAIAFPLGDQKWRYFDLDASGGRTSRVRDLGSESRLYWLDERSDSYRAVAALLGVPSAPFMIVFLPVAMEDRMLRLELAYNNLEEDEIATTHFKTVKRGGKQDVVVVEQIPR